MDSQTACPQGTTPALNWIQKMKDGRKTLLKGKRKMKPSQSLFGALHVGTMRMTLEIKIKYTCKQFQFICSRNSNELIQIVFLSLLKYYLQAETG